LPFVTLRGRTLAALYKQRGKPEGAWLDTLHRTLDEAVVAAYGWPVTISDDDVLMRLLSCVDAVAYAAGHGGSSASWAAKG
jgi:hypothetical protein